MVGEIEEKEEINRVLKAYILKDREKERLEDEAEVEKARIKKEQDEKKIKKESELKLTKEKLGEITKKYEQLQQEKIKIFEHLKRILNESNRLGLGIDDLDRLYSIGLAVTCVSTAPSLQPLHSVGTASATIISRSSATIAHQKRNRSPSPTIYRSPYGYKQVAGPHAFHKLEETHRNHEYNRSYLFKASNPPQTGTYGAFYSPNQNAAYTLSSSAVHNSAPVYSSYGNNRENVEMSHKTQPLNIPPVGLPPSPSQHSSSLYATHRSSLGSGAPTSVSSNHVSYLADHSKAGQNYVEDKYYIPRPTSHVSLHGNIMPIQSTPQSGKHGSITSGYSNRPVTTQVGAQSQLRLQQHNASHHNPHTAQSTLQAHHSPLSSHLSSPQSLTQQNIVQQSQHPSSSVHYQPSQNPLLHSQAHQGTQSTQQSSTVSVSLAQQSHHASQHHQQHMQQVHLQAHHSPSQTSSSSHHQLIQHHTSPSIHHTATPQHIQQVHHHHHHHHHHQPQQQPPPPPPPISAPSQHQSHSQSMRHSPVQQPHIQHHVSQSSQPTSVVTSPAIGVNAVQGATRVVYSQSSVPH